MANNPVDDFLVHNQQYASGQAVHDSSHPGTQPIQPSRRVALVACMDARLDVEDLQGLQTGEAHIIRNAGGVVTDDLLKAGLEGDPAAEKLLGLSAIHNHPWIPTSGPDAIAVRGFIYDVDTGKLDEVFYPGPTGSFG